MCFSAEASFAASAVLTASGIAISRVPKERTETALSLFPFIFAGHQFIEGILWLNHNGTLPDEYKLGAVYSFVFIAFILWPIYVPFSSYMIETNKTRRRIILLCQLLGIYVSVTFLSSNINNPIDATVVGHSFSYKIDAPYDLLIPYVIAVSAPFLISSKKGLVYIGGALTLSCVVALVVASSTTFPSVWCFFAAILCVFLYMYFRYAARVAVKSEVQVNTT
ncbi:MAG: hypothetical protein HQ553_03650 [Chloroflexi bacterium]|nr:hypothetical protein [Chloroflexota bacterium]